MEKRVVMLNTLYSNFVFTGMLAFFFFSRFAGVEYLLAQTKEEKTPPMAEENMVIYTQKKSPLFRMGHCGTPVYFQFEITFFNFLVRAAVDLRRCSE